MGDDVDLQYEDIRFNPHEKDGYVVSKRLQEMENFDAFWRESDLPHIIKRMAEFAMKRHKRLEKHPEKTEAKIYPIPG
jgi:hypothetical protein